MEKLTHQTIGELQGGGIGIAINQTIAEAMLDCNNRPGLTKKRKVIITLTFEPGSSGLDNVGLGLGTVGVVADVKPNFPSRSGSVEYLSVRAEHNDAGERVITANFDQSTPAVPGGQLMSSLDGDAIREVERLAQEARQILTTAAEVRGVYFLRETDGSYSRHRTALDPANVQLYDLESLAREINGKENLQTVYVSDSDVVALFDNGFSRWTAKVVLPQHPMFILASSFTSPTEFDQKTLVRLLRTQLSTAVPVSVIDTFQSLRFTNNSEIGRTVAPMSAGLDKSIHQAVRGENGTAAPESIELRVPVFNIPEARDDAYPVKVFVDYDHDRSKFVLVAKQDDVRAAQEEAVIRLIKSLEADDRVQTIVAYGKPL